MIKIQIVRLLKQKYWFQCYTCKNKKEISIISHEKSDLLSIQNLDTPFKID